MSGVRRAPTLEVMHVMRSSDEAPAGPTGPITPAMAGDAALFAAITILTGPLSLIIGPAASWLLHGRRVSRATAISLAISLAVGIVAGLAVVGGLLAAFGTIGAVIGPIGGSEFTFAITLLSVVGALFTAGLVALVVDAIRDLAPSRRRHVRLDVARLVATAVLVVEGTAITVIQSRNPAAEIGDAGVFALAAGAVAAVAIWVGGRMFVRWARTDGTTGG